MWKHTISILSFFPERSSNPSSQSSSGVLCQPGSSAKPPSGSPKTHLSTYCSREILVEEEGPDVGDVVRIDIPPESLTSFMLLPSATLNSHEVASRVDPTSGALPTWFPSVRTKASLYQAALKGDWDKAKSFIDSFPSLLSAKITKGGDTVLHIAAGAKQTMFVEEVVKLMHPKELELQNKYKNTALCFAAVSGNTRIAEVMVKKNKCVPAIRGSKGVTALHMAATIGHSDMVWFLYSVTRDEDLTKEDLVGLLIAAISSDLYDFALHILDHQPELAVERGPDGETALHILARSQRPPQFSGESGLTIWKKLMNLCPLFSSRLLRYKEKRVGINEVHNKNLLHSQYLELVKRICEWISLSDEAHIEKLLKSPYRPLFVAAELGNYEVVSGLVHSYPDLIWKVDEHSRSIFHIAVIHRHEKIFKLIYEIGAHKDLITAYKDSNNTNMLHLAGMLAPSTMLNIVSGAALQMQRELLWFKEVEKSMQPSYKEMRNANGQTPRMLFTEEHKGLVKAGERWMKDTASSCMLVAALITTVMFAAIFTVPGGSNSNGIPIFLHTKAFIFFAISDALALFSSVTAILMFLSILTSRYAEEDFFETLPKRLIIGLSTLFVSIASMLMAFSATFFIVLCHRLAWLVIPVALTACIPVTLFAFLQFQLLADMVHSSYGSGIFSHHS